MRLFVLAGLAAVVAAAIAVPVISVYGPGLEDRRTAFVAACEDLAEPDERPGCACLGRTIAQTLKPNEAAAVFALFEAWLPRRTRAIEPWDQVVLAAAALPHGVTAERVATLLRSEPFRSRSRACGLI